MDYIHEEDGGLTPVLRYDDVVTIKELSPYARYSFGTVSGYEQHCHFGKATFEQVRARIDTTVERGHKVVWLNEQATIISDPPTIPDATKFDLAVGQRLYVDSEQPEEVGFWYLKRERYGYAELVRTEDEL